MHVRTPGQRGVERHHAGGGGGEIGTPTYDVWTTDFRVGGGPGGYGNYEPGSPGGDGGSAGGGVGGGGGTSAGPFGSEFVVGVKVGHGWVRIEYTPRSNPVTPVGGFRPSNSTRFFQRDDATCGAAGDIQCRATTTGKAPPTSPSSGFDSGSSRHIS